MANPGDWFSCLQYFLSDNGVIAGNNPASPSPKRARLSTDFAVTIDPNASDNGIAGEYVIKLNPSGTPTLASLSLGAAYSLRAPVTASFTDAAAHTLATITLAANTFVSIQYEVIARCLIPSVNNAAWGFWRQYARAGYLSAGSATVISSGISGAPANSILSPFSNGNVAIATSSPSLLLQVTAPTPVVWGINTAYTGSNSLGVLTAISFVVANGNIYACVVSGTSAAAGTGPSGTGSAIVDNTATWAYVGPATAGIPVTWTLTELKVLTG